MSLLRSWLFFAFKRVSRRRLVRAKNVTPLRERDTPALPQAPPKSQASRSDDGEIRHWIEKAEAPESLCRPQIKARATTAVAQMRWRS